jgi:hypothetical protein
VEKEGCNRDGIDRASSLGLMEVAEPTRERKAEQERKA